MASEYHRGEMDVSEQSETFSRFIGLSIWFSGYLALTVLWLTLTFATSLGWMIATIATVIVGIAMGLALKMKSGWYVSVIGLSAVVFVAGFIASLFG